MPDICEEEGVTLAPRTDVPEADEPDADARLDEEAGLIELETLRLATDAFPLVAEDALSADTAADGRADEPAERASAPAERATAPAERLTEPAPREAAADLAERDETDDALPLGTLPIPALVSDEPLTTASARVPKSPLW